MGKSRRLAVLVIPILLLAGCGHPSSERAANDLLFLGTPRGVAVVKPGAAAPAFRGDAVPSQDWSRMARAVVRGGVTRVVALDPASGTELWSRAVTGRLQVELVSKGGDLVALSPVREPHYSYGRARTTLVVVGEAASGPQTVTLDGNFEPEAFSTDGKSLFVIEYLPARNPQSYRVRRLDLVTEEVVGVYTVDAELQRAMGGTARVQAASPDGKRLYTLYTLRGDNDVRYAFIHVLSLDELWAHCIDLPAEFAASPERATALTVGAGGERLYVANTAMGIVAEIDTEELRVIETGGIDLVPGGDAHAALGSDGMLYFASGPRLVAVDAAELEQRGAWLLPQKIQGIQVARDPTRVYLGLRDRVAILDSVTAKLRTIDPPGVKRIVRFGPVGRSLDEPPEITCAC